MAKPEGGLYMVMYTAIYGYIWPYAWLYIWLIYGLYMAIYGLYMAYIWPIFGENLILPFIFPKKRRKSDFSVYFFRILWAVPGAVSWTVRRGAARPRSRRPRIGQKH